jgi:hypothetical protein
MHASTSASRACFSIRRAPSRAKRSSADASRAVVAPPMRCVRSILNEQPKNHARFHGVLAPRAKLRPRIVPKLPDSLASASAYKRSSPRSEPNEPRAAVGEPPPPRDRTGPVVPVGLPVSATALARSVDGATPRAPLRTDSPSAVPAHALPRSPRAAREAAAAHRAEATRPKAPRRVPEASEDRASRAERTSGPA